jgi:SAM-dependent methyltransferase
VNPHQTASEQYATSANLEARINLHARFSTNPYGWHRWVFDQFDLTDGARILELGCGAGSLWLENRDRIPSSWEVTLSDFSKGMLQKSQEKLVDLDHAFTFRVIDAVDIPFDKAQFDAVIANHMLYYVEDKPRSLSEIRRVLKPNGRLYATTIGERHMQELRSLVQVFNPQLRFATSAEASFTLENGPTQVSVWFSHVKVQRYHDGLRVTDVGALIDYMLSSSTLANLPHQSKAELAQFVEERFMAHGGIFNVTKDSGMISGTRI